MLKVENLDVYYDSIHAIRDVSFEVQQGEIVTLIGANGAGKTTILHTISGLLTAKNGSVTFLGHDLRKTEAFNIVKLGLAHSPEGRRIFPELTVKENIEMGAYIRKDKAGISEDTAMVFEHFPRLKERINQQAGTLSGGEQQMLAMGRALMSKPKMLLLDEPSMGLSPILVAEIFKIIEAVNKQGMTVLLVEQNAHMALSIAHRAYVLETGEITMSGSAKDLLSNDAVRAAYLGK